ncbi:cell division control protein 2 homolog 3-like [Coccinella septempunctata]|uniref:cell division control protein 2 homolog 3-like n=1 Tax=Coccinella septempunctata TaxID=41139 RepID=UPI001D0804F8|nr:cell division control protein 2 homolog 3-like [Coccinella septempunctata]
MSGYKSAPLRCLDASQVAQTLKLDYGRRYPEQPFAINIDYYRCRMEKYSFEAILGEGGFGRVYRVRESGQEGQQRALKEVRLNPEAVREAEFMGLFDHCNILPLIETLVEPPHLYLPLCEEDLGTFLARDGPRRNPSSFYRVVRQIAVGLAECHRHSVVHRDLKPGNVLRQGARFMLADFGVAEQFTPCRPLLTELAGTPLYWSPEQLRREPYSTAVDLWALVLVAMNVAGPARPTARLQSTGPLPRAENARGSWPSCTRQLSGLSKGF